MVLHQIHLHLIVFDAHVEVVDVGVLKTLFFFPHLFVQLATNVGTNVFERRKFGHLLSVAEERLEKFAEGTVLEGANRPRLFRRKVFERRAIGDRLGVASDEIGDGVTFVRVNAEKAFASGIGDLTHVFRELDFGNESISLFDGRQFVDGTKFGVAVSRDEAFAHPVAVDAASFGR